MKILLYIALILFPVVAFTQVGPTPPVNASFGSPSSSTQTKGVPVSDSGYWYRYSFPDTSTANLALLKNCSGLVIRVRDTLFLRNLVSNKWIQIGSSSLSARNAVNVNNGFIELGGNMTKHDTIFTTVSNFKFVIAQLPNLSTTAHITYNLAEQGSNTGLGVMDMVVENFTDYAIRTRLMDPGFVRALVVENSNTPTTSAGVGINYNNTASGIQSSNVYGGQFFQMYLGVKNNPFADSSLMIRTGGSSGIQFAADNSGYFWFKGGANNLTGVYGGFAGLGPYLGNWGVGTMTPDSAITVALGLWVKRGVRFSGLPTAAQARFLMLDASGNLNSVDTTGFFHGGGGSVPTWQQTLTAGSTLTVDNTISGGNTNFTWNSMTTFVIYSDVGSTTRLKISSSGTSVFAPNGGSGFEIRNDSTLLTGTGLINDTTTWKPMIRNKTTGALAYSNWISGGGGGGGVTSVSAGLGMNFTTITTTGSVIADTSYLATKGTTQVWSGTKVFTANATFFRPGSDGVNTLDILTSSGNHALQFGTYPGFPAFGAIWAGNVTASGSNYILFSNGAQTVFGSTNSFAIRINNGTSPGSAFSINSSAQIGFSNDSPDAGFILALGTAGSMGGSWEAAGSTAGTLKFVVAASFTTFNWNWPTTAGVSGQVLTSGGGGSNPLTWSGLAKSLNSQFVDVGNVGAGEDNLMTYTVPAGQLVNDGDFLEFEGDVQFSGSNSKTLKVYFGAQQILSTSNSGTSVAFFTVKGTVTRTGATTQRCNLQVVTSSATYGATSEYTTSAETLSGTVVLKFTGTATADNDIVQHLMKVKYFPVQ